LSQSKERVAGGREPRISVVIPVYNGEGTIERCLDALHRQTATFDYEIIVADSSTDTTPEIIGRRFPSVHLIRFDKQTYPGTARNAAIRRARAPLVAMLDADCVADPDWLERIVSIHASGDYGAVGGAIANGTPESASGLIGYLLEFREFIPEAPRREVITIPTANICYRREVFERHGLFDDVRASEDMLFNWRISLGNERILFDPSIRVTHLNKTGWSRVIRYQGILGGSSALARHRMNPPFEVIRAYPALGWLMPFLIRFPVLGILVPPVRLLRAVVWLAKYDRRTLLKLLALSPMYLSGAFVWASAFVRGLRQVRETEREEPLRVPRRQTSDAGQEV
jgi:glycosyltransferase involved in cell wall biosynthesis